jgi:hypothetical protein
MLRPSAQPPHLVDQLPDQAIARLHADARGPAVEILPVVHAVPLLEVGLGDLLRRVGILGHARESRMRSGRGTSVRSWISCRYRLG